MANPIYDGAFKYLLDDNRIAKLFISTLIGEEILELTFRPTEHRVDTEKRLSISQQVITVFRMDFLAKIRLPNGTEKLVIIEIQKAKFATDVMRFRKYLGKQYMDKENTYSLNGVQKPLPILSIYLLGHSMACTESPVVRSSHQLTDLVTGKVLNVKEEFIESLTHDSIVVQIPKLRKKRQNDIECLLSIFDQSQKVPADTQTLSVREEDYPEKFRGVIRRLIKACTTPKVRELMDVEDDYMEELENVERALAKKDEVIQKKDAVIQERDAVIQSNAVALQEKNIALQEKEQMLENAVQLLVSAGLSEQEARAKIQAS